MATFTDKFIRGLKPAAKLYEERDAGCRGLVLRVGQRGLKVWEVVISRDGNRRRVRLGTYPDVSLAMARRLASEHKSGPTVHSQGFRVRDLFEMYRVEIAPRRRAFGDVEMVWNKWAEPVIGNIRLDDLNMRHGAELIAHVVKHSTPNRAQKVIRYLSPMLRFAAGRGLIPGNPWAGLHLPEGSAARDRVLSRAEWASVWGWAEGAAIPVGAIPVRPYAVCAASKRGCRYAVGRTGWRSVVHPSRAAQVKEAPRGSIVRRAGGSDRSPAAP